jgi:AcrR family transcriptional regulator
VKKGQRNRLSREMVLEAAARISAQEGIEALSMRRLATELDVWPMSIYTYFRDKDELLDALTETAMETVTVPSARASWRNQIRALLHETRRVLGTDLAGRLPRAISRPRLADAGLAILVRAGFGDDDAASAWRALLSYTAGAALTAVDDKEFERGLDALLDGLQARSL